MYPGNPLISVAQTTAQQLGEAPERREGAGVSIEDETSPENTASCPGGGDGSLPRLRDVGSKALARWTGFRQQLRSAVAVVPGG
jgi:hypothetical protein